MEERPHLLQKFFNYCGLMGFVLSFRTEIISSRPTIDKIISFLYTISFVVPVAILMAITALVVEIFYEKIIKPKIFKDDKPI